jgi:hypothetical protein
MRLDERLRRLEEKSALRHRPNAWPLVVILRPGDEYPTIPEGSHPLIIDCRSGCEPPDPLPQGVLVDAQDLLL